MRAHLGSTCTVTTQVFGPRGGGSQLQTKIINRIVTWNNAKGTSYEADPRHVELILNQLKLIEAKLATAPGVNDEGRTSQDNETSLNDQDATTYIAFIVTCNYLSPGRPDIAFTVEGLARGNGQTNSGGMQRTERLARYL